MHFDIAELVTRKIRKEYSNHISNELKDTKIVLDKIYAKHLKITSDSINKKYDKETNHGINNKKQLEWEKKIAIKLKELGKFAFTEVII